ncbi:MAG: cupin domain-containing protein [Thermodesulfobacteriota bacterium]
MKHYALDRTPFEPVSHDPSLQKRVLIRDSLPGIKGLSSIVLTPGDDVPVHHHHDAYEVFYVLRGRLLFAVNAEDLLLKQGECLVVEPGEPHSIDIVHEESELLYFKIPEAGT